MFYTYKQKELTGCEEDLFILPLVVFTFRGLAFLTADAVRESGVRSAARAQRPALWRISLERRLLHICLMKSFSLGGSCVSLSPSKELCMRMQEACWCAGCGAVGVPVPRRLRKRPVSVQVQVIAAAQSVKWKYSRRDFTFSVVKRQLRIRWFSRTAIPPPPPPLPHHPWWRRPEVLLWFLLMF